ncbi:MAG: YbaK/EbsC family protein [Bacillota bacterium]|nr:YbaK/EbsC family protein [Bacillota bacterium]
MSVEKVKEYFAGFGLADKVRELTESCATVELAAAALGTEGARIAKTLSFRSGEGCLLVVTAGDMKIDNKKFKNTFDVKAKMLSPEEVLAMTGHAVGGVCPFGIPEDVEVYLDVSLKRFVTVFPACGSSNSLIELSPEDLAKYANNRRWVDVCKER